MKPNFRVNKVGGYWAVEIFWTSDTYNSPYGWEDFEEPFNEDTYQRMKKWCDDQFKTYLKPKRVRRMAFNQFYFQNKKDLDWFILFWSGVDIPEF